MNETCYFRHKSDKICENQYNGIRCENKELNSDILEYVDITNKETAGEMKVVFIYINMNMKEEMKITSSSRRMEKKTL